MNILQVISGRVINGALIHCKLLSRRLLEMGHQVTVLTREDSWLNAELKSEGIPYVTSSMSRFPLQQVKRIAAWAKANQIDVIHTHMSRANSFGVMLKLYSTIPVVATAHSRSFQLHWKLNDFVIANSASTADYQVRVNRVAQDKLETIRCFIDLDKFKKVEPKSIRRVRRQLRLQGDEFLIGVVGDVCQRKGQIYLFKALQKLSQEIPRLRVVLLGRFHRSEPYTQQLRQTLIDQKLFRYTKWLGLRFNIEDFMSAFDVCVVPSVEEPLGMVAIESLAAGTPVVATNVGGLPEIVRHNENGLLVPSRDPDSLANAIIELAKNGEQRELMGSQGRQRVFNEFCPQVLTDQIVNVYQNVLHKRQMAA